MKFKVGDKVIVRNFNNLVSKYPDFILGLKGVVCEPIVTYTNFVDNSGCTVYIESIDKTLYFKHENLELVEETKSKNLELAPPKDVFIPEKELDDLCADVCLKERVSSLEQRVKLLEDYIKNIKK